jgi:hypothetical protein
MENGEDKEEGRAAHMDGWVVWAGCGGRLAFLFPFYYHFVKEDSDPENCMLRAEDSFCCASVCLSERT